MSQQFAFQTFLHAMDQALERKERITAQKEEVREGVLELQKDYSNEVGDAVIVGKQPTGALSKNS